DRRVPRHLRLRHRRGRDRLPRRCATCRAWDATRRPVGLTAVVTGSGEPVTIAAHGLGGSVAETRPLLGGVSGTRVFYAGRGHSGDVPAPFSYADLGDDLLALADEHEATRALGVSMGSGALLSVLARHPDRFEKVVCFL